MGSPTPDTVLASLSQWLGEGDDTAGWSHDHNPITAWYGIGDGAWCFMTVSYALIHGGFVGLDGASISLPDATGPHGWAYVPSGEAAARKNGWWREPTVTPARGWSVVYDWNGDHVADHIGLVTGVNLDGSVATLEGNRPDHLEGEAAYELAPHVIGPGGDTVRASVRGWIAWPYPAAPVAPAPSPPSPPAAAPATQESDPMADKTQLLEMTLGVDGRGWTQWDPGFGRDPVIKGLVEQGPYPPTDSYWPDGEQVVLRAQPRAHNVVVAAKGLPSQHVVFWVTVA